MVGGGDEAVRWLRAGGGELTAVRWRAGDWRGGEVAPSARWCWRGGGDELTMRRRRNVCGGVYGEALAATLAVLRRRQIGEAAAAAMKRWWAALFVVKPATNTHIHDWYISAGRCGGIVDSPPQRDLDHSHAVELGLHPRQQRLDDGLVKINFVSVQRYL